MHLIYMHKMTHSSKSIIKDWLSRAAHILNIVVRFLISDWNEKEKDKKKKTNRHEIYKARYLKFLTTRKNKNTQNKNQTNNNNWCDYTNECVFLEYFGGDNM